MNNSWQWQTLALSGIVLCAAVGLSPMDMSIVDRELEEIEELGVINGDDFFGADDPDPAPAAPEPVLEENGTEGPLHRTCHRSLDSAGLESPPRKRRKNRHGQVLTQDEREELLAEIVAASDPRQPGVSHPEEIRGAYSGKTLARWRKKAGVGRHQLHDFKRDPIKQKIRELVEGGEKIRNAALAREFCCTQQLVCECLAEVAPHLTKEALQQARRQEVIAVVQEYLRNNPPVGHHTLNKVVKEKTGQGFRIQMYQELLEQGAFEEIN